MGCCYVCKKESSRRCTRCLLIYYCSVDCQKSDWKYHCLSCRSKSYNVIDSLINAKSFDHIVRHIFHYLGGKDLHALRCTKRSWRDSVLAMWNSKADRMILQKRLNHQWKLGKSRSRTIHEGEGQIEKVLINGGELFLGVWELNRLLVFDTTKYKLKYTIGKAEKRDVWDVHTDFILVYDGKKIRCWDRKTLSEVELMDDFQTGQHSKELREVGLEWQSKCVKEKDDHPVSIKLFHDKGLIVYRSGLIVKFDISAPSVCDEFSTCTNISIQVLERFNSLMVLSPMNSHTIHFTHSESGSRHYMDGLTTAYVRDGGGALIWILEFDQEQYTIDGVEKILAVYENDYPTYIVVSRNKESMSEDEYEEQESDEEDDDYDTGYLQLHNADEYECLRTLKITGLMDATLNYTYMAVSTSHYFRRHITLWNMTELIDENIKTSKISPMHVFSLNMIPMHMLLEKDRFIWTEDIENIDDLDYCGDDEFEVKEHNFWYY